VDSTCISTLETIVFVFIDSCLEVVVGELLLVCISIGLIIVFELVADMLAPL